MSTDERINEIWLIHIIRGYSLSKRKEIWTHAKVWVNFKDIMINEVSQSQKDMLYDPRT